MSKALDNLYKKGSVNIKRLETDSLFSYMDAKCDFNGIIDKTMRFITDFQLTDPIH